MFGVLSKEVAVEDEGDAEEKVRVDGVAAEEGVNTRAGTAELGCEPGGGPPLAAEFVADKLANMDGGVGHGVVV